MTKSLSKRLLSKRAARAKLDISHGTFHAMLNQGIIKPGVSLGPRMKRWPEEEIDAIIDALVAERDQKLVSGEGEK